MISLPRSSIGIKGRCLIVDRNKIELGMVMVGFKSVTVGWVKQAQLLRKGKLLLSFCSKRLFFGVWGLFFSRQVVLRSFTISDWDFCQDFGLMYFCFRGGRASNLETTIVSIATSDLLKLWCDAHSYFKTKVFLGRTENRTKLKFLSVWEFSFRIKTF